MVYLRYVGRETNSEATGIPGASENAGGKGYDGRRHFLMRAQCGERTCICQLLQINKKDLELS